MSRAPWSGTPRAGTKQNVILAERDGRIEGRLTYAAC